MPTTPHLRALCLVTLSAACVSPTGALAQDRHADGLDALVRAYRDVPRLVDRVDYVVNLPGGQAHEDGFTLVLGEDGLIGVDYGDLIAIARDDSFYLAGDGDGDPYLRVPLGAGFADAMARALGPGARIPPPPHAFAREDAPGETVLAAFSFGLMEAPELQAIDEVRRQGKRWRIYRAAAPQGRLELRADARTGLVHAFELSAGTGEASLNASATLTTLDEADRRARFADGFTTDGRTEVDSAAAILNLGPTIGAPAPDIRLVTPSGHPIDLADQRDRIVVLDFWATWCGNCFLSLPALQRVATIAEAERLPVRFYAVNSRELFEDQDQRRRAAQMWWDRLDLSLDWVIDPEDDAAKALRASAFPTLVVVDRDGTVAYAHSGYDPDLESTLIETLRRMSAESRD